MTKTFFAAAATALSLASPAVASERSFTRDGIVYSYTTTEQDGARVLEGRASQGGKFRLVVRNGWVKGDVAGNRVSFRAPKGVDPLQVAQR
ncbi:hypothetical protein [Sphingomonas xinjiangensis]|uniref:Uncharacterized protein n=1 Tax=Sphingomonas xinjiangensis TaxID=643568 RepID=A0A840YCQ8_9SPHN|nr:hypothetical protein [Sphingomonas xinjiangensis]